jgi:hypothetical protein
MDEVNALHVANQLIGMPVIVPGPARKLGQVADAVVHTTEGRALGPSFVLSKARSDYSGLTIFSSQ